MVARFMLVDGVVGLGVVEARGAASCGLEHGGNAGGLHFPCRLPIATIIARGVFNSFVEAFLGVFGHLDGREQFFDLAFDVVGVDVAYNDDGLIVRTIPCVVVVDKSLGAKLSTTSIVPMGGRWPYLLLLGYMAGRFFDHAHLAGHRAAPFFVDNTAFGVDLSGVEGEGAGPVVEMKGMKS